MESNSSRKELMATIIRSLFEQSDEQLKNIVTVIESGVKLYNGFCNVPIEIIEHHEFLGPQDCVTYNEFDEKSTLDRSITPSDVGFTNFDSRPTYKTLYSDYLLNSAERYVPHEDYVLCDSDEVLMQGDGPFAYEGHIFYAKYNGSASKIYTTKNDKERGVNRFVVCTNDLLKIVHKNDVDQLKREKIQVNENWRRYEDSSEELDEGIE